MLPLRHGVGPSTVVLPGGHHGRWATLAEFLAQRFPAVTHAQWVQRMQRGEVVDAHGRPVDAAHPFAAQQRYHYYREWPDEPRVPFDETVLFEDDWLLVADKPHFLPVTPKGRHVRETLLARLRDRTGLAELSPIHRIDRETAGVVVFAKHRATRHAYQQLFAQGAVHKVYEAIVPLPAAPHSPPPLMAPWVRRSRLEPAGHFMQMREVPDVLALPNAETRFTVIEQRGRWLWLKLEPRTGKRHQLRVHLMAQGMPIAGDRIYPVLAPEGGDRHDDPLRLLACEIGFADPVTGATRHFRSAHTLDWPIDG